MTFRSVEVGRTLTRKFVSALRSKEILPGEVRSATVPFSLIPEDSEPQLLLSQQTLQNSAPYFVGLVFHQPPKVLDALRIVGPCAQKLKLSACY